MKESVRFHGFEALWWCWLTCKVQVGFEVCASLRSSFYMMVYPPSTGLVRGQHNHIDMETAAVPFPSGKHLQVHARDPGYVV